MTAGHRPWRVGDDVLGVYTVREVIDVGGRGVVYRVRHEEWRTDLAVKEPRAELVASPEGVRDFVAEAQSWVGLGLHPHTVGCVYVRTLDDGVPRVFAEWVDGGSLSDAIRGGALYRAGQGPALRRAIDLAIQYAWGLQHAHDQRLVHQDVKPANALVTADGTLKVTDFGLARARSAGARTAGRFDVSLRAEFGVMTPAYCSPEQDLAVPGALLSRATDVWSWALTVLAVFVGDPPTWRGSLGGLVLDAYQAGELTAPHIPTMPAALAALLRRCLATDPAARPVGMAAIADELIAVHEAVTGEPYPRPRPSAARLLADGLSNQALSLLDLDHPDQAEALWDRAVAVDPHHLATVYNQGLHLWRTGRLTDRELIGRMTALRSEHADGAVEDLVALVRLERGADPPAVALRTKPAPTPAGPVRSVALSPDGRLAASGHTVSGSPRRPDDEGGAVRVWDVRSGRCLHRFDGHPDRATAVALTDRLVASGGDDGVVLVRDLVGGGTAHRLTAHAAPIDSVALSADSTVLVSLSEDGVMRAWHVGDGRCVRTWTEPRRDRAESVAADRDGRHVVRWGGQRIRVWDLATGHLLRSVGMSGAWVRLSAGARFALAVGDRDVTLWEVLTGRRVSSRPLTEKRWETFAVSDDGRWALVDGVGGVQVRDLDTGRCVRTLPRHAGHRLVTAGGVALGLFDGSLGSVPVGGPGPRAPWRYARPRSATEHTRDAEAVGIARDRARRLLEVGRRPAAAAALRPALRIAGHQRSPELFDEWARVHEGARRTDLLSARRVHVLPIGEAGRRRDGHVHEGRHIAARGTEKRFDLTVDGRLALSLDRVVLAHSGGAVVVVWDLATGTIRRRLDTFGPGLRCAAFCGGGRSVVAGGQDGAVRVWDVATGGLRHTLTGHTGEVGAIAVSADGRCVATGGDDGTVRVWDPAAGRCTRVLRSLSDAVATVAASADGRLVVVGGVRGDGEVWDAERGERLAILPGSAYHVTPTTLSADHRTAVTTSRQNHVIWASDPLVAGFSGETVGDAAGSTVQVVTVSLDGRLAYAAYADGVVRVWDLTAGEHGTLVHALPGHAGPVTALALTADRAVAVTGGDDGTIRVWDLDAGRCLRVLEAHLPSPAPYTGSVVHLALSADARTLLSVGADRTMRTWRLDWDYAFPSLGT